jgi:CRISPR system Cascade subunit CasD
MVGTLLIRLAGPMQAWGIDSRFDIRETLREPTKSGVIGLVCAALGKPRQEVVGAAFPALASLAALRMGVRVDREGTPAVDYQTAGGTHRRNDSYGVRTASDKPGRTVQSRRHYLADASFLVGLEGDAGVLQTLAAALHRPVWQLCLGRKAFVPGLPVSLPATLVGDSGVVNSGLERALGSLDWSADAQVSRRAVIEVGYGGHTEARQDVPVDFALRRFSMRYVAVRFLTREGGE